MAKEKTVYSCTECGGTAPRWMGQCPHCQAWNTLVESVAESATPAKNRFASLAKTSAVATLADIEAAHRNFKRSVESLESPTQPWVGSRCLPGWLGTGAWAVALSGFGPP